MNSLRLSCLFRLCALPALTWLLFATLASAAEEAPLRIPRVSRPPKLSDFIDGTPREAEVAVTVFKQFDPHDGEPISQQTTAYLSYDHKNLYIGWICKDDPSKIRARVAPRKQIDTDDRVTINIDTFQDHKHAYWFDVNPYGIQYDGRTTDGIGDDPSWEGLWYTDGRITSDGYVVLETIPFRSLRFPAGHRQIWNICLARFIQRTNEFAIWPAVTHQRLPQFVGQFAPIEIDEDISPGRNMQMIPYGLAEQDRYLDTSSGFVRQTQRHPGLDAKFVLHDAFTLDIAANPDFSEIGSDDPKVQVNQRFEVIYPERRPFFLENASIFSTQEQLFFSRRIVNPQFGAKLTGSTGRWGVGALVADDRAPGEVLVQGQSGKGQRAWDGVFRVEREFAQQSHVGLFLSDSLFNSRSNRVAAVDLRYLFDRNWLFTGQATASQNQQDAKGTLAGRGYEASLRKSDNHTALSTAYTDRSADLTANLGYLDRTDIRKWETYESYNWKPASRALLAYGPALSSLLIYDHKNTLQNWAITPNFSFSFPRLTWFNFGYSEAYEAYQGKGFREQSAAVTLGSSPYKWLDLNTSFTHGDQPNYYPPAGVAPFLGKSDAASTSITVHTGMRLRLDEIYYYTRLAAKREELPAASLPCGVVFTNHLIRSKFNYQFTRNYSFRAILDYNSLLPNPALVSNAYSKQADVTLLFTYLPHPGTALYIGYANTLQNVNYSPGNSGRYTVTNVPDTSTDRQLFAKFSYLFRF